MNTLPLIGIILFSQYFGQNKIQYKNFDFSVLRTQHFNIYFDKGGEDLAAFAEEVLEDGYVLLSEDIGIEIDFTIPVILYNSPNDFAQTNITISLIEEGVGGFTEILKNRMVIPYTGDYAEFRHVLVHELTHVFQFAVFFPSRMEAIFSGDILYSIPLWVMEGHAEFESVGWNLEVDIIMRDLVMNNKVVPLSALGRYGGYLIYKEGQAFYNYVAEKYGRQKVGEFIHMMKARRNLDAVVLHMFGVTVEQFEEQWLKYYQARYWPKIELSENFDDFARVVYDHDYTGTAYNTSTALSSYGDKIAFISDKEGDIELIVVSSIDGAIIRRLVKARYSAGYENLHLFQGGVSWSPDDSFVTFAARAHGNDVLYIVDAQGRGVDKKFILGLDAIYAPRFSSDGEKIVFSGLKDGYTDIYVIDVSSGNYEKVTDDIYTDKQPSFSEHGSIAFVSDRPDSNEGYLYGSYAVYIDDGAGIRRVTPRTSYVAWPLFDPQGGLFFVADYDSAYNLYWYSQDSVTTTKKTDILTGIYYPSIARDGSKIAFTYYDNYGYDVCVVKDPVSKMEDTDVLQERISEVRYDEVALNDERIEKYRTKFTIDYFTASASYYSSLGFAGLAQLGFSDILGNHHFLIATDLYGSITSSNLILNYWYIKNRIDYGVMGYHYFDYFREGFDLIEWRYLGVAAFMQYPFDRFLRAELGWWAYRLHESRWLGYFILPPWVNVPRAYTSYNVFYPSAALVYDNVKWGSIGPHSGRRLRLSAYSTVFSGRDVRSVILDHRRYFHLSPRANLAARLVLAASVGQDAEHWSIGGPGSLRGYDYYAFYGSKVGFLNLEYRFPFVDYLKLSVPLPLEIRSIRGVLFADLGGVYSDGFRLYDTDGGFRLQDAYMGVGGGVRFSMFYIVFNFEWARAHNFREWTDDWKFYFTIGPEW